VDLIIYHLQFYLLLQNESSKSLFPQADRSKEMLLYFASTKLWNTEKSRTKKPLNSLCNLSDFFKSLKKFNYLRKDKFQRNLQYFYKRWVVCVSLCEIFELKWTMHIVEASLPWNLTAVTFATMRAKWVEYVYSTLKSSSL
jgi:hypothetical protein